VKIPIPLAESLIEASGSYEEFRKNRARYFREISYTSDFSAEERTLSMVTNDVAYRYWAECMKDYARQVHGFHAWKEQDRESGVVIGYHFNPGPDAPHRLAESSIVGGFVPHAPAGEAFRRGTKIRNGHRSAVFIQRRDTSPIEGIIGVQAHPKFSFYSEWVPAAQVARYSLDLQYTTPDTVHVANRVVAKSTRGGKNDTEVIEISAAGENHYLRNVSVHCTAERLSTMQGLSYKPSPCGTLSRAVNHGLDGGAKRASATISSSWSVATYVLVAEEYRVAPRSPLKAPNPVNVRAGASFTFSVPKQMSAILKVHYAGSDVLVVPGEPSDDGRVVFESKVDQVGATHYQYRINPAPVQAGQ
jgi:hypothetical protein